MIISRAIPAVASSLRRFLHAPIEHVSIMAGSDDRGDILTVFVSKEWAARLPTVPKLFEGVRVKVEKRGKVTAI